LLFLFTYISNVGRSSLFLLYIAEEERRRRKACFLCATFFLTGHSGVWVLMMLMMMQRWDLHHRSFSVQMSPQKVCEISALQTHGLLAKNPQTSLAKGNKERSKSSGGFFTSGDLLLRVLLQNVVTN
jgi:hypothetical protein